MQKIKAFLSQYGKLILRLFVGVTFIISSICKLITLDEFEIYIHSFGLFNYVTCTIFSRLLIMFEFLTGTFLILKFFYKYTWHLIMLSLLGFTLFLIYIRIFRGNENCHCFGSLIDINPINSIIKNIILMGAMCGIYHEHNSVFRWRKWCIGIITSIGIIVPFFVFPMDVLYNKFSSPIQNFNEPQFEIFLQDSTIQTLNLQSNDYMIAFYISGCKYCKMSMRKVKSIFEHSQLDDQKLIIIILGDDNNVETFKKETATESYRYYNYTNTMVSNVLKLTYGSFPTFAFIEKGKPIQVMDFRGLDEQEIADFINH